MASFGLYEVTFQDAFVVGMPLSDKMVSDAVDQQDPAAVDYLCDKICILALICDVEIDANTISVSDDLVFNRIRHANYGDHFREYAKELAAG
jgi:hypothetical protein